MVCRVCGHGMSLIKNPAGIAVLWVCAVCYERVPCTVYK